MSVGRVLWAGAIGFALSGGCNCGKTPPTPQTGCDDVGVSGYFPLSVGYWWAYEVLKGKYDVMDTVNWEIDTSLAESTYHETIRVAAETSGVYTWLITNDQDASVDTMKARMDGDTLRVTIQKTVAPTPPWINDTLFLTTTVPYAVYPSSVGSGWETNTEFITTILLDGDTVPDSVFHRLRVEVQSQDTLTLASRDFCTYRYHYPDTMMIWMSQSGSWTGLKFRTLTWWSPYEGPVKRVEQSTASTSDLLGGKWLIKKLTATNVP